MNIKGAFGTYRYVLTKRYAHFEGRADARELWLYMVTSYCITIAFGMVDVLLNPTDRLYLCAGGASPYAGGRSPPPARHR